MQRKPQKRYIFVDPNPPQEVQKLIKAIIVEKLLTTKARVE